MPPPTPPRAEASLLALRLYYFASFAALGVYLPLFPRWLEGRGVEGLAMGAIVATVPAMSVVAPPAFGLLADALDLRGWLLRAASAGAFVAFGALALGAALGAPLGFGALFFAALAFAFFRAPMVQLADVVALDVSRATGALYGRLRLWGSLGFALAAFGAAAQLDLTSPVALPAILAGALLLALVASFSLPARAPSSAPAGHVAAVPAHARALLRAADFRLFLAASFLAQGAHSAYDLCFSLHLRDLGFSNARVGVAWALGVLAEIALMALAGHLLARARPPTLLAVAFAGAALRWALLAVVRWPSAILALQPLHAFTFALMWIASLSYIRDRAPPRVLATAQGLFTASAGAGSVIGMLAWGPLYRSAGGAVTFGAASVAAGLAFVLAATFSRRTRQARYVEDVEKTEAGIPGGALFSAAPRDKG